MKYIILVGEEKNIGVRRVYPIIFPDRLVHADTAKHMIHQIGWDAPDIPEVLSAGTCYIDGNNFQAITGSESLKIKPSDEQSQIDTRILNMPDAMQGII